MYTPCCLLAAPHANARGEALTSAWVLYFSISIRYHFTIPLAEPLTGLHLRIFCPVKQADIVGRQISRIYVDTVVSSS